MPEKRVLILANSIKKKARCVAGREIIQDGGEARLGGWVRPVSGSGEGELFSRHYALKQGGSASVLDVVDIPLQRSQSDPGQPENWLIDDSTQWSRVRVIAADNVAGFVEHPADLWLDSASHSDRITVNAQADRSKPTSLVLIRPEGFHVRLWREHNPWKGYVKRNTRVVFRYAGQEYSLSMTDPIFDEQHCGKHPAESEGVRKVVPPFGDNCLLCISLTPPFNEYHYKVVATVLALP